MRREAKDRKGEDARDESFVASHRVPAGAIKMPPPRARRGAEKNSAGTKAYGLAPPFNGYGQRPTRVTRLSVDLQEGRLLRRPPVPLNALSRSSAVEGAMTTNRHRYHRRTSRRSAGGSHARPRFEDYACHDAPCISVAAALAPQFSAPFTVRGAFPALGCLQSSTSTRRNQRQSMLRA